MLESSHPGHGSSSLLTPQAILDDGVRTRLAAIVASANDAIISQTPDGTITSWNLGAEKIFGYAESEAIGHPASMLIPAERVAEEAEILARIAQGARVESFESVWLSKGGEPIDISATISPVRDSSGAVVEVSRIARDITDRKRTHSERTEQAEILDLAQVMVRDTQGRILLWNDCAETLYGYTRAEALGRLSHELLSTRFPEPREQIEARFELTGMWQGELTHRKRDGSEIAVVTVWTLHRDAEGRPRRVLESYTDVTERRRAELELADQLARHQLLNTITRAIGQHQDLASIFQVVISTLEDQLPIDFGCVCLYQPPDTLAVVRVGLKGRELALDLGLTEQATIVIGQNGLARCVGGEQVYEPDLQKVKYPFPQRLVAGGLGAMVAAPLVVEGKVIGVLIVARRAVQSFSSGEREFLGQLTQHVALAAQQTQLHNALQTAYEDLRETQQAVMQHEKLRVLGQMASGIAHDINNALSPATLYIDSLLAPHSDVSSKARGLLILVQRAIEGVAQTVSRMKEFYSVRDPQRAYASMSLNRAIEQVIEFTRPRWSAIPLASGIAIRVTTELQGDLPAISGDAGEIRDALINLILNAVDAMPKGGVLTLRSHVAPPNQVLVEVTDTGIGMDEATRNRCLELFFTTQGTRGTGLGLAMVYGTVKRHRGEIQVESVPGAGTTIRLVFPIMEPLPAQSAPRVSRSQLPLRILAIDDDPLILNALRNVLEQDGHRVDTADGGQSGIDLFRASSERSVPFDVIISDLGMPHVDGRAVANAVKSIRPGTPIFLLTGWGHQMLADGDTPPNVDRVFGKPPKLAELRSALADLTAVPLDQRSPVGLTDAHDRQQPAVL